MLPLTAGTIWYQRTLSYAGRFCSVAMDERQLCAASRYIALIPAAAGLAARPRDWPWSSARGQLGQTPSRPAPRRGRRQ
jgi:hypothetical protein